MYINQLFPVYIITITIVAIILTYKMSKEQNRFKPFSEEEFKRFIQKQSVFTILNCQYCGMEKNFYFICLLYKKYKTVNFLTESSSVAVPHIIYIQLQRDAYPLGNLLGKEVIISVADEKVAFKEIEKGDIFIMSS